MGWEPWLLSATHMGSAPALAPWLLCQWRALIAQGSVSRKELALTGLLWGMAQRVKPPCGTLTSFIKWLAEFWSPIQL